MEARSSRVFVGKRNLRRSKEIEDEKELWNEKMEMDEMEEDGKRD